MLSLLSVYDGCKHRKRFILSERIKYYIIGFVLSFVTIILVTWSSNDIDILMILTIPICLLLILGSILFYVLRTYYDERNYYFILVRESADI